jgi:predicted permease
MPDILRDVRAAMRRLWRRPLYPIVAVGILALGLTATIAVFTYINGFYQPFPGADANGLVRVFGVAEDDPYQNVSFLDYVDYAGADRAFDGIAAAQAGFAASVRREQMTEVAFLEAVSGAYFSVLGVELYMGRGIRPDDDRPGADPVAVLSHTWWQRSFNADPSVIGQTIFLNFRPFTVVGIMSPQFLGTTSNFRPHVWIPIAPFRDRYVGWAARAENRDLPLVRVFGRLRERASVEQGLGELTALAHGLDEMYPKRDAERRQLRLEAATWIDPRARLGEVPTLRLMTAAAIGLLLLVGANVANLLLAVAVGRQRDVSLRAALGASRPRLMRLVLIENVLLSALAGGIALALAYPATARLGSYFARPSVWGENVSRVVSVDLRVVVFAIAVSIVTGLVAGLLPALRASGSNLVSTLNAAPGATVSPRRLFGRRIPGVHDLLVSTQVALSIVLLVVAGLVVRTFVNVGNLDPGFAYGQLIVTHVSTSSTTLRPDERERFFRELAQQVSDEPWVQTATVVDFPLLSPHPTAEFRLDGADQPSSFVYSRVIPGFFEALGIGIVQGRSFSAADTVGATDVAMVNERFVRLQLAGQDPVGRRIWWSLGEGDRSFEIVGVVRDTKTRDYFAEPEPTVYFSYPQHAYPTGSAVIVATRGQPHSFVPDLSQWLRDFEPYLAIVNVVPYADVVRGYQYTQRMNAELFSIMAFVGVALAAAGIFSVMSIAVTRRTREIGIRMSVGAARVDIGQMVVARALKPVVLGLGVGLAASFAVTKLVRSLLYGVEPTDPLTLLVGTGVLLGTAALAAYVPAHRAATLDPAAALRRE